MRKLIMLFAVFALQTIQLQAEGGRGHKGRWHGGNKPKFEQFFHFSNEGTIPVAVNCYAQKGEVNVGVFGWPVDAGSKDTPAKSLLRVPEFYWFEKKGTGFGGKNTVADVLNHSKAQTIEIVIPNQSPETFSIDKDKMGLRIFQDASGVVKVEPKAPEERPERKTQKERGKNKNKK